MTTAPSEPLTRQRAILERGFFVEREFLKAPELARLKADADAASLAATNAYALGIADRQSIEPFAPRIEHILAEISDPQTFAPTHIAGGAFFAIEKGINFAWHQDHESYFIHQTHRNYLNVYIPIVKPDPARSNLSIVPIDSFLAANADLWRACEGRGASSAIEEDGKTQIRDDHAGGFLGTLPMPMDELAITPELAAGDALFLRGDLFHKTQDTSTPRVALSIRVWEPAEVVTRAHFETTCDVKEWFRAQNPQMYDKIGNAFAARDEMQLQELFATLAAED